MTVGSVMVWLALVVTGSASVHAFGWIHGVGILAGVYLLMPWSNQGAR